MSGRPQGCGSLCVAFSLTIPLLLSICLCCKLSKARGCPGCSCPGSLLPSPPPPGIGCYPGPLPSSVSTLLPCASLDLPWRVSPVRKPPSSDPTDPILCRFASAQAFPKFFPPCSSKRWAATQKKVGAESILVLPRTSLNSWAALVSLRRSPGGSSSGMSLPRGAGRGEASCDPRRRVWSMRSSRQRLYELGWLGSALACPAPLASSAPSLNWGVLGCTPACGGWQAWLHAAPARTILPHPNWGCWC